MKLVLDRVLERGSLPAMLKNQGKRYVGQWVLVSAAGKKINFMFCPLV
jgi:hypothetical protein